MKLSADPDPFRGSGYPHSPIANIDDVLALAGAEEKLEGHSGIKSFIWSHSVSQSPYDSGDVATVTNSDCASSICIIVVTRGYPPPIPGPRNIGFSSSV